MIEQVVLTGNKHSYASDIQEAQVETLEPLQKYFKNFGTCIVEGLTIVANGSNWDISEGIVAINHADGFKLARFAAVTNVALPGYLSISKTTQNGPYDDNPSKVVSNTYTATFTAGAAPSGADLYLVVPAPTTNPLVTPLRFLDAVANKAIVTAQFTPSSTLFQNATISVSYNKAAKMIYLNGYLELIGFNSYAALTSGIPVVTNTDLNAAGIPTPSVGSTFLWTFSGHTNSNAILDANSKDYIRTVTGSVAPGGLFLSGIKPITGTSMYPIYFNAALPIV